MYEMTLADFGLFDADIVGIVYTLLILALCVCVRTYQEDPFIKIPDNLIDLQRDDIVRELVKEKSKVPSYSRILRYVLVVFCAIFSIMELHLAFMSIAILKGVYSGLQYMSDWFFGCIGLFIVIAIYFVYRANISMKTEKECNIHYTALVATKVENGTIIVKDAYKELRRLYAVAHTAMGFALFALAFKVLAFLALEDIINVLDAIKFIK